MKKILFAALALSTFIATSAMAAPQRHAVSAAVTANTVTKGTTIAKDPDANVRLDFLREVDPANVSGQ